MSLKETILYLIKYYGMPFPARLLHDAMIDAGFKQAEVLGTIADLLAKDRILCKPDATHGAVYVLP